MEVTGMINYGEIPTNLTRDDLQSVADTRLLYMKIKEIFLVGEFSADKLYSSLSKTESQESVSIRKYIHLTAVEEVAMGNLISLSQRSLQLALTIASKGLINTEISKRPNIKKCGRAKSRAAFFIAQSTFQARNKNLYLWKSVEALINFHRHMIYYTEDMDPQDTDRLIELKDVSLASHSEFDLGPSLEEFLRLRKKSLS